jgi:hypothetical protein
MSSETERITHAVLNRHHLGKPEEGPGTVYLQDPESHQPNSNDAQSPHQASIGTEEAVGERLD